MNKGIAGKKLSDMLADAPALIDPLLQPGNESIVIVWGGINDIANGATPAAVYANMNSYCTARHAAGWNKCIIVTMLSSIGRDTQKNTLNNLMLTDHSFADGLVDFTATPLGIDNGYSDSTYFLPDGVHPNQNGVNTIEAPVIRAVINPL